MESLIAQEDGKPEVDAMQGIKLPRICVASLHSMMRGIVNVMGRMVDLPPRKLLGTVPIGPVN